mmetsp:Transcript_14875/g.42686  ORF Transcript_14875/g.42686 Transcript_14875/m.42686 type:complete len:311 (-) Transcript_14875:324-1256(-)
MSIIPGWKLDGRLLENCMLEVDSREPKAFHEQEVPDARTPDTQASPLRSWSKGSAESCADISEPGSPICQGREPVYNPGSLLQKAINEVTGQFYPGDVMWDQSLPAKIRLQPTGDSFWSYGTAPDDQVSTACKVGPPHLACTQTYSFTRPCGIQPSSTTPTRPQHTPPQGGMLPCSCAPSFGAASFPKQSAQGKDIEVVIVWNLPQECSQMLFIQELSDAGFRNGADYDYLLVPSDTQTGCSLGCGVVHFVSVSIARAFVASFEGRPLRGLVSEKVTTVTQSTWLEWELAVIESWKSKLCSPGIALKLSR